MSNSGKYRVSLHISHPKLPAGDIAALFTLPPKYARSVGEPRTTRSGKELGGVYAQTDVSFAVSDGIVNNDSLLLAEFIDQAMCFLPLEEIKQMTASGGTCFFFIGIYSDKNLLCDFGAQLLLQLACYSIGLKLDFYGGPEE